jgi:hypothetical protein
MTRLIKEFLDWALSRNIRERPVKDAAEKLQMSIRVTAKCRYNAASRLQRQSKFSFFTTTLFSLGLIFIPLMQNAGVSIHFNERVINMMVIFLAVAVLVYSVVIGTARYDVRAENLTECGDKLKELTREIDKDRETHKKISADLLSKYQKRYSDIVTDTENHERSDYRLAVLEMTNDYFISGLPRITNFTLAYIARIPSFTIPITMIFFEIFFIFDMIGITNISTPFFMVTK